MPKAGCGHGVGLLQELWGQKVNGFSRPALRFAQILMNAMMGTTAAATPTPSAPTRW